MLKYCLLILVIFSGKLFARNPPSDSACIPVITIADSQKPICSGAAVTLHATVTNEGTNGVYNWKKNNQNAGVNSNANFTYNGFHEGDVVVCEYKCKTPCGADTIVISNSVTMHVDLDFEPTVTVANYDSIICEGELTVFSTTASYGNAVPLYEWTVNGAAVGTNSPVFSTSTITNGSRIECKLSVSTPSCPGTTKSATSQLTIYVYPMVHPAITIKPSKTDICRGETVTFTALANGGAFPSFDWMINGKSTGASAPSLTTASLHDGDTVSCIITIDQDSRCHTGISAPSNGVVIHVSDYTDPTLQIAAPVLDVCPGIDVIFTATPQNAGSFQFFQWRVNGHDEGNGSSTFIGNQFKNGDKVSCLLSTDIPGCPFNASVSSNEKTLTVHDGPVITFSPPQITVVYGESAQLQASVSGKPASILWRPEQAVAMSRSLSTSTMPLMHDTVFNLTVTDTNGCRSSKDLPVRVLHKLYMPSAFTPNVDGTNDVFRIPPGASINLIAFIVYDRWGNVVFKTNDITKGWNGTYHGENLSTGAYVYLIKGTVEDKEVTIKGTVTLLR